MRASKKAETQITRMMAEKHSSLPKGVIGKVSGVDVEGDGSQGELWKYATRPLFYEDEKKLERRGVKEGWTRCMTNGLE